MFYNCRSLETVNLTGWNCGNGGNGMFQECTSLTSVIGMRTLVNSKWTKCDSLFRNCTKLADIDISGWDTSNVTDMNVAFAGCAFTEIDIRHLNLNKLTNISSIFGGCSNLQTIQGYEKLLTEKVQAPEAFRNCYKLSFDFWFDGTGKPPWTFKQSDGALKQAFYNCGRDIVLEEGQECIFDMSDCGTVIMTNGVNTFSGMPCTKIVANINFAYPETHPSYGTQQDLRYVFGGCKNLKELIVYGKMGNDMRAIVYDDPKLTKVDFSNLDFKASMVSGYSPLNGANNVTDLKWGKNYSVSMSFSQNTALTVNSLMSIINNLPDLTNSTTQTLTLGSANLAKLSSKQIAIATNKGWTVL